MRSRHLLPVALLGLACATSSTGRRQLIIFPEDQMAQLGATAYADLKANEPVTRNAALTTYVNCIAGAIITANRDRVKGAWEITTFESDQINAFALPGRKIGIYTGMAQFADNQDQLAAVVGHEIGHVLEQHGNERMSQAFVAQTGLSAVDIYQGEGKELVKGVLGLGVDLGVMKPFSRTHESEADEVGLVLMAKAGFNPQGAVNLWQKMATLGSAGPEFLSTHPAPRNRARALANQQSEVASLYQRARRSGRSPACRKPRA